jgi:hypothetical protein
MGGCWLRVENLLVVGSSGEGVYKGVCLHRYRDGHWKTKYFEPESFWTSDSLSPVYLELELMIEQERLSGRVRSEFP